MHQDMQEFGPGNFHVHTLAGCISESDGKFLEQLYVRRLNTNGPDRYNNLPGDSASSKSFGR